MNPTQILSADQIRQKIRRIASQLYETNFDEAALVLAGVAGEGYELARRLADELKQIAPFTVTLVQIDLDKAQKAQPVIALPGGSGTYTDRVVVLIDDVLYSGRTLAFSLQPFLSVPVRKIQVAVLVNRNHPRYPIAADFIGLELATTLNEHVEVILSDPAREGVYLQ
ncbi:phosphoribosyltransferase family protein [Fibrivirga algicola]|uniref:Phosphoribosyltransferase n=1 Tax=Fibrivirga algicola TaxID=2950420 RepID=A0ABX0QL64_9BACT|nr:phosphoribosyltransferase family protein [Fibrivirga algicola]ARK11305.1 phosphoribosyltransferase [Fibrella sp. ES10-3-2-2]NID13179.1 phosphoribosyltransferase [Fibrivirga algicola]